VCVSISQYATRIRAGGKSGIVPSGGFGFESAYESCAAGGLYPRFSLRILKRPLETLSDKIRVAVTLRPIAAVLLSLTLVAGVSAQRKKNKKDEEPPTQVLPPLPDPPDAVVAETARLSFQVSPLSNKGLLSQQVRDALKALLRDNHGAQIVKLRAFVAGSGDLRRVQTVMVEEFTDRKLALPALSTIQAGGLPITGAQVVIEATSVERRAVNPDGLAFYPAVTARDATAAVAELRARSSHSEILRVTCYLTSVDDAQAGRTTAASAFPGAIANFMQAQRQSLEPFAACEGVGRSTGVPAGAVGHPTVVRAPKIVMTGTKLVFRDEDSDIRLAFQRLGKAMEPLGASFKDVFWTGVYPLTRPVAGKIGVLRKEFVGSEAAPDPSPILFEGLPSTDATAAIELMAAGR
jgi:enamine deaminase RidA (YjgF/YER057c/UK114 family)